MHAQLQQFATAASPKNEGILAGLGIDFTLLVLQGIAFLLMVFVLAKWVYPVFMRILDEREDAMNASAKAAEKAQAAAEKAEANVEAELRQARHQAAEIVATAKSEATAMTEAADKKAKARAERTVNEAKEEIDKSVIAARKALEADTLQLVKKAASLATSEVADSELDSAMIKKAMTEAKK